MRHGLAATWSDTVWRIDGPRFHAPTCVLDVSAPDGSPLGAVYGPVTADEAARIVDDLLAGADPRAVDVPWMAVARRGSDGLIAHASSLLPSGLFWSWHGDALVVASDPAWAAPDIGDLDPAYVSAFAGGLVPPTATPFRGVQRVASGTTVTWQRGRREPQRRAWIGPEAWGEPRLAGPEAVEVYRRVFADAAATLRARTSSVVATVSGGLDSTFVTATLAGRAEPDHPVRGLCYSPHPGAGLVDRAGVDASEFALAQALEARYAGLLHVEAVVNEPTVRPLVAATHAARLAGVPAFNPANEPWLQRMRSIAAAEGAALLFVGTNGNAAFSHDHAYAARASAAHLRVGELARMARDADGRLRWSTTRSRVLRPLRHGEPALAPHPLAAYGQSSGTPVPSGGRGGYLTWLARGATALPSAANPNAMGGVLYADPFSSRAVLDVAAAITPAEWQVGGQSRGFARRVMEGRVPDPIRLRTRRGQQGQDAWFAIREDRDDYLDRVRTLAGIRGLEHLDVPRLAAHVERWPWGQVQGPSWPELVAVDRNLSVAAFVDVWRGRV